MIRLKQFSKRKPCYYCGSAAPSTQEHAPPKLIFSGFECDSITVPSCNDHNNQKAPRDRAVATALIKSLHRALNAGLPATSITSDARKAIEHLVPNFAQANREVSDQPLLSDAELRFDIPAVNISVAEWICQLSAALVWSATGQFDPAIKWTDALVWSPTFIEGPEGKNLSALLFQLALNELSEQNIEKFEWHAGWCAHPRSYPHDVYNFSLCFSPTLVSQIELEVAIRHQFYGCLNWYVWFTPSQDTRKTLQEAIID
jgi:hypothetical protein